MACTITQGRINAQRGTLWKKSSILKKWKSGTFILEPANTKDGKHSLRQDEDKDFLIEFSRCTVSLPDNADASPRLRLSFLVTFDSCNEALRFKTSNVHEQRSWMAAFGASGKGLFSNGDQTFQPLESWLGKWDVTHPCHAIRQMLKGQEYLQDNPRSPPAIKPPSYQSIIDRTQADIGNSRSRSLFETSHMEEQSDYEEEETPVHPTRRPMDDSFLPPHGPAVLWPVSLGIGPEIGLEEGVQQIWDPTPKRHVYVNHVTQEVSWIDPRPSKPTLPTITPRTYKYGDEKREFEPSCYALREKEELDECARLARNKPKGLTIDASGIDGLDGHNGMDGKDGEDGNDGYKGVFNGGTKGNDGGDGGSGHPGASGEAGKRGTNGVWGTAASDLKLFVDGDASSLKMYGSVNLDVNLGGTETDHIVFLDCRGGNGGNGGHGGKGGSGGEGGNGGDGASGRIGNNALHTGADGDDGGDGGRGGDGGPGGFGAKGGDGGNGGDAGVGGNVQITARDPSLFMLIECDCRSGLAGSSGKPGRGGHGGAGGCGGIGGDKGIGGIGGPGKETEGIAAGRRADDGKEGNSGCDGVKGRDGSEGCQGPPGTAGTYGSILWTVLDKDDQIVSQVGHRYDVEVTHFEISSQVNDGVFEPNEKICIKNVQVKNTGGMPLPAGTEILFKSTQTINFEPIKQQLPQIEAGETYTLPHEFSGRIFDAPSPNQPGCFKAKAECTSRAQLVNRPFDNSFSTNAVDVQYPVRIVKMEGPKQLGRGEYGTLKLTLSNVSSMPYGDGHDCGGYVEVKVRLDRRILPYPANLPEDSPYQLNCNHLVKDSVYIRVHRIEPHSTLDITLDILIEAGAELFDRCLWQADLHLRGKLIEYNYEYVRVAPFYIGKDEPADILFVTGPEITRQLFVLYQTMFEYLGVSLDFWDVEREKGFSINEDTKKRHEDSWVDRYKGKMIIYPYAKPELIHGTDVATHFHGATWDEEDSVDLDSAMMLMATCSDLVDTKKCSAKMGTQLCSQVSDLDIGSAFFGRHLFRPGSFFCKSPAKKKAKAIIERLERENPGNNFLVYNKDISYEKMKGSFLKYSYGLLRVRRNPLKRSARLVVTNNPDLTGLGNDDPGHTPGATEVPIGTNFGQTLLTVIFCLPINLKAKLIRPWDQAETPQPVTPIFTLPSGERFSLKQLVALSLEEYLIFELSGQPLYPARLGWLVREIDVCPRAFADESVLEYVYTAASSYISVARGMRMRLSFMAEADNLFKKMVAMLKKHGDVHSLNKLESRAKEQLADKRRLRMDTLLNKESLLFCHRKSVCDKMYDLQEAFTPLKAK